MSTVIDRGPPRAAHAGRMIGGPCYIPAVTWRPSPVSIGSWALYDLANTVFALGVGSLYFASWLTDNVPNLPSFLQGNGHAGFSLGLITAIANVIVIALGPWIGALGDHFGRRPRLLIPATLTAVVPTFFLATVGPFWSLALYGVALVGFNLGSVVYDSMLPDVSTAANIGRISGMGIAVGYLGSLAAWGIGQILLDSSGTPEVTTGYPAVFRAVAIAFLAFALPAFFFIRERPRATMPGPAPALAGSLHRLVQAWRRTRQYRGVTRFLVGRFFYTDAINTLIAGFLTVYAKEEVGFTDAQVQDLLIVAIAGSVLGGFVGGRLVDTVGPRRLLHWTLHSWLVAFGLGIAAGSSGLQVLAWPLGALGGLALGSTWAADRVYMQRISPPRHLGEFYGLYVTVGRFASVVGPILWGPLVVTWLGWPQEAALGALALLLIAGRVIIHKVDDRPRDWAEADLVPEA
jgi:MFS transporter, UMF1 family